MEWELILRGGSYSLAFCLGMMWEWRRHRKAAKEAMPYRWDCPNEGCAVHLASNDMAWTDRLATNHERICEHG